MKTVALAALLIAGTAVAGDQPRYKAIGTEPFWALTIERGVMRLEQLGYKPTVVRAPVARPSFNGRRYVTRRMTVDVTRSQCSDGMSDRTYPDTVTVTVKGRTLRGCGGGPLLER